MLAPTLDSMALASMALGSIARETTYKGARELPFGAAASLLSSLRAEVRGSVRRSFGVPGDPPPRRPSRGKPYLPLDAVARRVHGDLASMVVGGVAALFLQALHPLAMAGVAEHSTFEDDAITRLRRTASFIGATTFGTVSQAKSAIEEVRAIHRHVRGRAPDGRSYSADDPELLTWVHTAEVHCFLEASKRFGPSPLDASDCDRYFEETAPVAIALGARWVPTSVLEAESYLKKVRPELYAGPQARAARDFLVRGVSTKPADRAVYSCIVASALSIVPTWARVELGIPVLPLGDELVEAPARLFCSGLRWALRP